MYNAFGDSGEEIFIENEKGESHGWLDITMREWHDGVILKQGKDVIMLDAKQVEELYTHLKHNR